MSVGGPRQAATKLTSDCCGNLNSEFKFENSKLSVALSFQMRSLVKGTRGESRVLNFRACRNRSYGPHKFRICFATPQKFRTIAICSPLFENLIQCYVSSAQAMPVSMRGSAFVSFKHETKEEFEQRRALEKEFLFTNEYHDKLVTRGLSDRCAELELERRSHLNFSSPMSQRSTPSSSPAPVVRSRRPSYETTSPIAHRPAPSPSDSTRRPSYETTSPLALRPPRSSSDASSSSSDSSIPSTSSSTPASTFRKGVPEWSVRAA